MKVFPMRFWWALLCAAVLLSFGTAIVLPAIVADLGSLDTARIAAVARQYPNFTVAQRRAELQAIRAQQHPTWSTLSPVARAERTAALVARWARRKASGTGLSTPGLAPFQGNQTFIINASGNALALRRMADCSLSRYDGGYTISGSSASVQITQTTPHYEQVLHAAAGLATQAGVFAGGCHDPMLGIGSRRAAYLGLTSQGAVFGAGSGFNPPHQSNALYYGAVDFTSTASQSGSGADFSLQGMTAIAAGDLNGDGLADVVGLDRASGTIDVWLANPNGTFGTATPYSLGGTTTEGAVIADVNGDGKPDVVVATRDASNHEQLWVLAGNGSGALTAGPPQAITTPTNASNQPAYLRTMVAADLRATGHADLLGTNGLVLLNDGTGTFTAGTQPAFAAGTSTSDFGPNLAVADFNRDGKLDVALDDGEAIHLYLGHGDGTFTPGSAYVSDSDVGYLTATDLDGDGNTDLYVGLANGGVFAGDQFGPNQSYAIMGNGDGTLSGAPVIPFVYTGTNLADLDGDGHVDAVGLNADGSFTSYLGDGHGSFSSKSTLQFSPVTYAGTQYPFSSVDSFGLADVNGDGHPDLVFITEITVRSPQGADTPGVIVALGDGHGGFGTPTFIPAGPFVPGNDVDGGATLSNLSLADVNHDGKADLVFSFNDSDLTAHTGLQGFAVQVGNGDGTFQPAQTLLVPYVSSGVYHAIAFPDFNRDGHPDLLFTTSIVDSSNRVEVGLDVALGHGDGTFGTPAAVTTADLLPTDVLSGTQYAPVAVADMNGDGIPDIVALGATVNSSGGAGNVQVAIALGNGDGTFKAPSKTTYEATYGIDGLAVADFDGDGKPDVAITGPFPPEDTGITFGNGDGTLRPVTGSSGVLPSEVFYLNMWGAAVAADFNGDGKPDLLAGQTLMLNLGATGGATPDFSFSSSATTLTATAGQSASASLTVTPIGGFDETIAFSCSGLLAGASCSFSPATVTPSGSAVNVTLTIATAPRTGMGWLGGLGSALASCALAVVWRHRRESRGRPWLPRRRWIGRLAALVLAGIACAALIAACGGGSGSSGTGTSSASSSSSSTSSSSSSSSSSSAGTSMTSTVTVTAAASGPSAVTHTATIVLDVQ